MFGRFDPQSQRYEPFHLYSMRQAIEEGFIMDVLANYTTYQTFWKIEKATEEDPEYDAKKARRAIARFVSLHPYHLAQKSEIIVEHFRQHTSKEMGGLAKAMVVTSSRLHAVRYKQNIDKYIGQKGYANIRTLVAFSGPIDDGSGVPLTESNMNGFPKARTAEEFSTPEFGVLIVAEKFQTGFDQPIMSLQLLEDLNGATWRDSTTKDLIGGRKRLVYRPRGWEALIRTEDRSRARNDYSPMRWTRPSSPIGKAVILR
jgi:type I restriction enzyme R subunit